MCGSQVQRLCVDAVVRHTLFKVHVRQGSRCLPIGIHLPTGSDPDAAVDTTAREPCRQDTAVGLISQAISIGFLLAGQLVLALRVPAVVSHITAEGHHAIAVPLCFEQAGCLLIIHSQASQHCHAGYQARGPRCVMMSTNSALCTSKASLGNHS